ncbi:hypothetical protein CRG98_005092 [Punica granatum]|uniref:Reverse transcriptase/retrotransposon-derived protein RNase H-like domain-containing protein n=1 Tax=Punica granatum TaxID=22663 RepID=A0A2I0L1D1_PUNGR|nr:hypothetical protein CRG98_005092 [Punica granatum]
MAEEDKIKTTFITMWGSTSSDYPAKCTFGVKSGKLLGFVVSEKGIEVDPDKVKAIMELPPPSIVREVRSFLGRLNYNACFIANLIDKCQPLFRLLCKNAAVEWDDECQKAFDTIKAYLVQPPVLVPPSPDCPLILYLTADPLKYLLGSPSSMRNIAKWRCQLTEYDIEYVSRTSVKGPAIADHLAEFPIEDDTPINSDFLNERILQVSDEEETLGWKMYFDGVVNSTRSDIKHLLQTGQFPDFTDRHCTDPNVNSRRDPHARDLKPRGLGVSTFPWGRVTDTRERRSRHLSFYDPEVGGG